LEILGSKKQQAKKRSETEQKSKTKMKANPNNKPVHQIRLASIKAAIWQNTTATGDFFNVTFERLYMDGAEWKSTSTFGRDDLLTLAKVADKAHDWIFAQRDTAPGAKP
jgi:hypothetical protein